MAEIAQSSNVRSTPHMPYNVREKATGEILPTLYSWRTGACELGGGWDPHRFEVVPTLEPLVESEAAQSKPPRLVILWGPRLPRL
jgi:hypothetical protein